jgi:acetoin utilization deacetylase AcuC-like enzyme
MTWAPTRNRESNVMIIVFHRKFHDVYDGDPAAARGRMKGMVDAVEGRWPLVAPEPAEEGDILRCHSRTHLESEREDPRVYAMALLAAGGAIKAALSAASGERAFALIRPPGHHASHGSAWGFCHFNNAAVALMALQSRGLIKSALILDFDLHYGDGTSDIFGKHPNFTYLHPEADDRAAFVKKVEDEMAASPPADMVAVSAGFDRGIHDWGGMLLPEDYRAMGRLARAWAERQCKGRVFGVLEGGYNHDTLGECLLGLLEGLEE